MDTYIFKAYYFGGEKREVIVKANSRFTAYGRATILATQYNTNLDLIELEKTIYKF